MRVFFKSGSTVTEITNQAGKFKSDSYSLSFTDADYLYLAVDYPLNHFYVKLGDVKNAISSEMNIDYWSNEDWVPVVNKNDYTNAFSSSGFIEFTPDRDKNWTMDDTNAYGNTIDGLGTIVVYDKFWIRISVGTTLTSSIDLEFIGNVFSDDTDLYAEFPIFNDFEFIQAFESGKVDWQEQHVKAADIIIQDLKKKNVIMGAEQILDRSIMCPASVSKTAEIIFNSFGKDYTQNKTDAFIEYNKRIDLGNYVVDSNGDGISQPIEIQTRQGWLSR